MARSLSRRDEPPSDSSQKENAGVSIKVKKEKAARSKVVLEDRARRGEEGGSEEPEGEQSEREATPEEDVEEEDGEEHGDEDEEAEEETSPKGKKRSRLNGNGDSIVKKEKTSRGKSHPTTHVRDIDGYVSGSIVRIMLHNFVTYDDVEFRPGPYLNMILGPNGTGKSSIACAICLGLNFPPSVLGRATEISSFVKIGNEEGFIEIELKGSKGRDNLVIRRHLKAKGRGSTFTLNGEHATAKEVTERVKALNVQVNNLCTFLPQDKVAEFAAMTPQQLLVQTQLAAGDGHLSEWHKKLIENGKELSRVTEGVTTEQSNLKDLEDRNALLERDVQLYKQRREIERQVELLEVLLPFKEYMELKDEWARSKARRNELHDKVKKLEEKNKPAHQLRDSMIVQHKELEKQREARKEAAKAKFRELKSKYQTSQRLENDSAEVTENLLNLKKEERARKERISKLKIDIQKTQQDLDNPPEVEDVGAIEVEKAKVTEGQAEVRRKGIAVQDKMTELTREIHTHENVIKESEKEIYNLNSVAHRRYEDLCRWDSICGQVVKWLRENPKRFQQPIIEPPVLCMDVPNQKYAAAVEACFNTNQLRTFVAQTRDDYKLLNQLFCDTPEALGRKVQINTWFRPFGENVVNPAPLNEDEMRHFGFDKYAIDCVDCPEALKWFLKCEINLHRTAIALDGSRINTNEVMLAISRGGGANFIAGKVYNQVTRSRYGTQAPVNLTRDIGNGRNLVHQPIDQTKKREFERRIGEAQTMVTEGKAQFEKLEEERAYWQQQWNKTKNELNALNDRKANVQKVLKQIESLGLKLESYRHKLQVEESAPTLDSERQKFREKIFGIAKKRATIVKNLRGIIQSILKEQTEATRIGLQFVQVQANKIALENLCKEKDKEYQEARAEFENAIVDYEKIKRVTTAKMDEAKAVLAEIDDELRATFQALEQDAQFAAKSADDVRQELADFKAKLELNLQTNPGVVEQYEARQAQIEALKMTIANREARQRFIEKEIKGIKDQWYPALQELISNIGEKFSEAFDRVRCAGEVKLAEHETDYEKWAIDILVKFRDSEKLQLLTGTRQSGGERALSTIMYLMSLTELARAPFSLVDEINQGMDAIYERAVHNSLVSVTCKADSGQYFLITPKLLTDLHYHERMKVLCVNNGEWLPEPEPEIGGNMMKMIEAYVAKRRVPTH